MGKICYETIRFSSENGKIKGIFMDNYYFYLTGNYDVENGCLVCSNEKRALRDINNNLMRMRMIIDDKETFYINSGIENVFGGGIPLLGANFIGIVDRGTNIIELKPNTGCNLNCIFCSVDEGKISKKSFHYIVESDYLFEKTKQIIDIKRNPVDIYINPHGEPLLYYDLERLIALLNSVKKVRNIAVITNGVLLNKEKADRLINNGCTQINISFNAINDEIAKRVYGNLYPVKRIMEIIEYISEKISVVVSPVLMKGINDNEIKKIVKYFSGNKNIIFGIQNFLPYKRGRNPVKQLEFDEFNNMLKEWEEEYKIKLINPDVKIKIEKDVEIEKPYRIGDKVDVMVLWHGRYKNEYLGYTKDRLIVIRNDKARIGKKHTTEIIKNKDNIYYGI